MSSWCSVLISVLWVAYGYSMRRSAPAGALTRTAGGLGRDCSEGGMTPDSDGRETFSTGVVIPELQVRHVPADVRRHHYGAGLPAPTPSASSSRRCWCSRRCGSYACRTCSIARVSWWWFWGGPSLPRRPSGFLFAKGALDFRRWWHGGAHQRRYRRPDGRARARQAPGVSLRPQCRRTRSP